MPSSLPQLLRRMASVATLVSGAVIAAGAAQPVKPAAGGQAARVPTATNAAPVVPEPPKSVFYVPASTQDPIKDPFFPLSTRLRKTVVVTNATNPTPSLVLKLELRGISGSVDHRLAIINSRTFAAGEEGEIANGRDRVRIRVVEIKGDSVTVQINGELQVLRLRTGV